MQSHNVEIFKFSEAQFPPDFVNLSKTIPSVRISGEEEFYLKSSALPQYEPFTPTSIYSLPLKLPTHHFIYKNPSIRRYKTYSSVDEKDIEYLFNSEDTRIED